MSLYSKRGVSAQKEEVHAAVKNLDQGIFPNAFCKIYPDHLGGDKDFVNVMHADGAGTKSILAYLYWKETGDLSVWKGIAQDAVVMNLDDLLCVGISHNIIFNSTIDRNKNLIPGEVLEQIISGTQEVFDMLKEHGVGIHYLGGETADVGDVVRTVAVNGTMTCRIQKNKIISNDKIKAGDVIVGLASFGQANYETEYNSGIGSNGLTSARHDLLDKSYSKDFKESFDNNLDDAVVYIGKYRLGDVVGDGRRETTDRRPQTTDHRPPTTDHRLRTTDEPQPDNPSPVTRQPDHGRTTTDDRRPTTIGKLLLSPTRTFAPVMKKLLAEHFEKIHGLIHCSGGGQTKCLKYLPGNFRIIKDTLFPAPLVFELIREGSGSSLKEMYEVFNMGCRLEIYCDAADAQVMIDTATSFGIAAQVIGRVEESVSKELVIKIGGETLNYKS
ncbi:MAG: AIR synthase related protein [Ferruginibacter sp.]